MKTTVYKGYLIRAGLFGDQFHVSRGGSHITTVANRAAAHGAIDQITDDEINEAFHERRLNERLRRANS